MARNDLVICGFEQGPLASGGTAPAELDNVFAQCKVSPAGLPRSGNYHLLLDYTVAAANTQGDLPFSGRQTVSKVHRRVKHGLRVDDPGSGYSDGLWLWKWGTGTGPGIKVWGIATPQSLELRRPDGSSVGFFLINYGQEYIVELYWRCDAGDPYGQLLVDGVSRITSSHASWGTAATPSVIQFGQSVGKGITERQQPYTDDMWVMEGDAESDAIPDPLPKILAALPNLDGDTEEFTGSPDTTNHYANVDDASSASKDDTDYNESGTATAQKSELYNFRDSATIGLGASDIINAVQASCIARVPAGTNGQPSLLVKDSGTEYTTNMTPGLNYITNGAYTRLDVVQPNGGAAWTQARLDAFQAGMRRAAGASDMRNLRLSSIMLMVGYQPARRRPIRVI